MVYTQNNLIVFLILDKNLVLSVMTDHDLQKLASNLLSIGAVIHLKRRERVVAVQVCTHACVHALRFHLEKTSRLACV